MLSIKFIREHSDIVKRDLDKRGDLQKIQWVDDLIGKDKEYRGLLQEVEQLRHKRNIITDEINQLKKQGKDFSEKIALAKSLPERIKKDEERIKELQEKMQFCLMRIPNILHDSVPVGKDSNDNVVVRTFGKPPTFKFPLKSHGELIEELGCGDFKKAAEVTGTGFYYLKNEVALLDISLQRFAIDFLMKKGFTFVEVPYMLNRKAYEGVTNLDDFENVMYKIENNDLYMIATSEHPLVAQYMNEVIGERNLPIKMCSVSPCFRREIGSHGLDTRGIFRVHQFNKVEQVVFCKPEDSWALHEEIQKNSEEMYQLLKIPHQVVSICTGDIGIIAAKKYDIEAWSPRENKYFEVTSASNCTAYQAVRLNIRYETKGEREYVHTLNNTGIATSRAIRAILENYQQEDGSVKIPKVLQKYMNGIKVIKSHFPQL
jgi:seryl-tRNA synthetase